MDIEDKFALRAKKKKDIFFENPKKRPDNRGPDNRGTDNRGSTVILFFSLYTSSKAQQIFSSDYIIKYRFSTKKDR